MVGGEPSATRRWSPGTVVAGKYRVLGPLGEGGMGVVLRAQQVLSGQEVALKVLPTDRVDRPEAVVRLLREARAVGQLRSQHTVRLFDTGLFEDGSPYLALELLDGQDLGQYLRAGVLSVEEAAGYVLQACEALAEAHGLGIVHRDLKPSNLFLHQQPGGVRCLKVLDFGLARSLEENDHDLTRSGGVLGSPKYMAPEQVRSARKVDARADLWALGVVLYELVSRRLPFESDSSSGVLAAVVADPPVPLRTHLPGASDALLGVLDRCLRKAPEERFASAEELARALAPLVASGADSVARIEQIGQARRPASAAESERTADPLSSDPSRSLLPQETTGIDVSFSLPEPASRLRSRRWALPVVGLVALAGLLAASVRRMEVPDNVSRLQVASSGASALLLAASSLSASSAAGPPLSIELAVKAPEQAPRGDGRPALRRRVAEPAASARGVVAPVVASAAPVVAPAASASSSTTGTRL